MPTPSILRPCLGQVHPRHEVTGEDANKEHKNLNQFIILILFPLVSDYDDEY